MTAMGMGSDSIGDLINFDQPRARYRWSAWVIATSAMAVVFIAASVSYTVREDRACDRQYEATLSRYHVHALRVQQIEQIAGREIAIAAQATIEATTVEGASPSLALADISSAVSPGVRLSNVSFEGSARASAGDAIVQPRASVLRITGVAASDTELLNFVARLASSGRLHRIEVIQSSTNEGDRSGERRFELAASFQSLAAHAAQSANGW
jgi:Tfp pilus assembly protein PilN